jgi:hypothetical protein
MAGMTPTGPDDDAPDDDAPDDLASRAEPTGVDSARLEPAGVEPAGVESAGVESAGGAAPRPLELDVDLVPEQTRDDADSGWGSAPTADADPAALLRRYLDEKPPHHGD